VFLLRAQLIFALHCLSRTHLQYYQIHSSNTPSLHHTAGRRSWNNGNMFNCYLHSTRSFDCPISGLYHLKIRKTRQERFPDRMIRRIDQRTHSEIRDLLILLIQFCWYAHSNACARGSTAETANRSTFKFLNSTTVDHKYNMLVKKLKIR